MRLGGHKDEGGRDGTQCFNLVQKRNLVSDCGPFLRKCGVFAYVGLPRNLKDIKHSDLLLKPDHQPNTNASSPRSGTGCLFQKIAEVQAQASVANVGAAAAPPSVGMMIGMTLGSHLLRLERGGRGMGYCSSGLLFN